MRTTLVKETWKPQCKHKLEGLYDVLRIRADRCLRKRNHRGRHVGTFLVWDSKAVAQLQKRLQGKVN
jgi:hypothetical protein